MGRVIAPSVPDDLKSLRTQIEHWRATRQKQGPMPADLWSTAVSFARVRGTYPVSRALRIDYSSLRVRLAESRGSTTPADLPPQASEFVELAAPPLLAGSAGTTGSMGLELLDADGSRMRLRLSGADGLDVSGIVSAFRRRPA